MTVKEMIDYLKQFEDYQVVAEPYSTRDAYESSGVDAIERAMRHDKQYFVIEGQF